MSDMPDRVLLSPPDVGDLEEKYVLEAMRSGWVAPAGPHLAAFEEALAERTGVEHVVALSSGTAALHLALLGLGIGHGDVVLVPTVTFVATANAVVYTGAEPCFVDVDSSTGNVDPAVFIDAVRALRDAGRRVAALITVDLFGKCADYDALLPAAEQLGVLMVEDAAEALGASYGGRAAGCFGRVAALSFNGNKIITTSGGGALVTDDQALASQARYLSTQAREPVVHYEHRVVGYNYRLSNLLAALGLAQLERLDGMIACRRMLRERYRAAFGRAPGTRLLGGVDDQEDNCWLSVVVVDPASSTWTVEELAAHLTSQGIECRPVWKPMHLQPVFRDSPSFLTGAAERLFAQGLALPSGSGFSPATVDRVSAAVDDFVEAHT